MQNEITADYLASQGLSPTFPKRFWERIGKDGSIPQHCPALGRCWTWRGAIGRYGRLFAEMEGKKIKHMIAHRASWILHNGPIPEGLLVLHKCDNKPCSNPHHLYLGTYRDNTMDTIARGQFHSNPSRGANNPMARLTWGEVDEIRRLHESGEFTHSALALRFNVGRWTITGVLGGKIYRNQPAEAIK